MAEKLTDEEHEARAMLLGMRYHHGNGEPFYYAVDADGGIEVTTMIDANTLEPFINPVGHFMDNVALKASTSKGWDEGDRKAARHLIARYKGAGLWLK